MANIILIGMMGSGKSTISKMLCDQMHFERLDTDDAIETQEGMSINKIFETQGEGAFRTLEQLFLKNLNIQDTVLSTGGGMVLSELNRYRMKQLGCVIYLKADVKTLVERLYSETENRPLLSPNELEMQLSAILADRAELYTEAANGIVEIDGKSTSEVCAEIYTILREMGYNFLV